jgi:hypothetical protein
MDFTSSGACAPDPRGGSVGNPSEARQTCINLTLTEEKEHGTAVDFQKPPRRPLKPPAGGIPRRLACLLVIWMRAAQINPSSAVFAPTMGI